jgi:aminomethyltransferase
MVDFAGWEMPVSYSGILEEHRAVRSAAGLFDVSHMGEVELRGPHALEAAQRLVTNDVARLGDGAALYAVVCKPDGGVVDDVIVTRLAADRMLICVNASNREKDVAWIRDHAGGAEVVDRSDELALLALQGPAATRILAPLADTDLASLVAFHVVDGTVAGKRALISRTGYTGEDGFEIYLAASDALHVWDRLIDAGAAHGLLPAGLGARDTLRLEAGLPLYGHELDEETTPLEAGLGWVVRWDKGDFLGREALARRKEEGLRRRLVGLEMRERAIPRQGHPIRRDGRVIGAVTSGTMSPTLGHGIALGYVEASEGGLGSGVEIEIRGSGRAATIVRPRFLGRRGSGGETR